MSITSATHMNLVDLYKTLAPDGTVMDVAQVLNEMNDGLMSSINFIEGNMENGHQHGFQTSLPATSLGAMNKGVVARKGTTAQVTDTVGRIESLSEVAVNMLERSPNPAQTRMIHDRPHIESMHRAFLWYLWYGNTTTEPLAFDGLTQRYNSPTANNGDQVINGAGGIDLAGRTDLQSIWLINWSPSTITGLIPKRTVAGLQTQDWGEYLLPDDGSNTNARIKVMGTYFRWDCGVTVQDWRYAVRICNLPVNAITPDASVGPNLPFIIKEAAERLHETSGARMYMSRRMKTLLGQQIAAGVENSTLTKEEVGGISSKKVLMFDDIPLFRTDSLVPRASAAPDAAVTGETAVTFS